MMLESTLVNGSCFKFAIEIQFVLYCISWGHFISSHITDLIAQILFKLFILFNTKSVYVRVCVSECLFECVSVLFS